MEAWHGARATPDRRPRAGPGGSLRILHIPHAYPPVVGGTERLCQGVSEELARKGHEVFVLTTDVTSVDGYYRLERDSVVSGEEIVGRVQVTRLDWLDRPSRAIAGLVDGMGGNRFTRQVETQLLRLAERRLATRIVDSVRRLAPDVVLALPHLVRNVWCTLSARERVAFPLVLAPLLHEEHPGWPREAIRSALTRADAVTAISSWERDALIELYRVPAEKVFLARPGVDIPKQVHEGQRQPRILFLGRQVLCKGLLELIDAMRIVLRKRPDAELVLAGPDSPDAGEIKRAMDRLTPAEHRQVIRVGSCDETEKARLLSSSLCLALPSKTESFGLVLLESWAHGTPVLGLDMPVFREIVTDGVDGVLAAGTDPRMLAEALELFLGDPVRASDIGSRGRQKVIAKYSWAASAESHLEAYEHAIRSFSAASERRQSAGETMSAR